MMASRLRFIFVAIGLVVGLGSLIALATALAATVSEQSSESSSFPSAFVQSLALIRPGFARQHAFTVVSRLQSRAEAEQAQATISALLALSPTDATLWMMQAQLAASLRATDRRIAEILKMSYLTAPGNFDLMPSRLDVAMTTGALSDSVLEVLAEGDVRAILRQRTVLSDKLIESYHRATEPGKAFLKRAAASDPRFAARLTVSRRTN